MTDTITVIIVIIANIYWVLCARHCFEVLYLQSLTLLSYPMVQISAGQGKNEELLQGHVASTRQNIPGYVQAARLWSCAHATAAHPRWGTERELHTPRVCRRAIPVSLANYRSGMCVCVKGRTETPSHTIGTKAMGQMAFLIKKDKI